MTSRDFRTAAEARAERLAEADRELEAVKRAVEGAVAAYDDGDREWRETLTYCRDIGLGLKLSGTAGLEFLEADAEVLAARIATVPMPASLQRYHRGGAR